MAPQSYVFRVIVVTTGHKLYIVNLSVLALLHIIVMKMMMMMMMMMMIKHLHTARMTIKIF
jgi:hypothetical protein